MSIHNIFSEIINMYFYVDGFVCVCVSKMGQQTNMRQTKKKAEIKKQPQILDKK